ncbi:MAG: SRPBCC family protein [Phenylobacterium sp.]|uniref:SRPBCC family protein n=1 Tax=Phenylobacterium sp. TaxID=1871053 RepID=UPI002719EB19|nr:SRPBCC family protein [Phenylobacterium sp.]MDO8900242.1 SRPBCC family protein [Phenylobacterium sp.]
MLTSAHQPHTGPSAQVSTAASASLAQVWAAFVPIDLAQVFPRGSGPIPAVVGTRDQTGPWDVVGSARQVHLADGTSVREEILASDPSDGAAPSGGRARFAYRVDGFTGPLAALTDAAFGEWTFVETAPGRTEITWRYTFVPRSSLMAAPLSVIIALFWRTYMRRGIENVRRLAEAG